MGEQEGHQRYVRTHADFIEALREQLQFLRHSAKAFDEGATYEAKRLATVVRTLVHHAPRGDWAGSHALLVQLDMRDSIQWLSTSALIHDRDLMDPKVALCALESTTIAEQGILDLQYVPMLDERLERARMLSFGEWWNETVIRVRDDDGVRLSYSRKDLVLTIANKDGGAHVDPAVPGHHRALTTGSSTYWWVGDDGTIAEERRFVPGTEASLRQIAFETLASVSLPLTATARGLWTPGSPFPYEDLLGLPPDTDAGPIGTPS